eukprot:scaffold1188_cov255-Pinguiococcus_pyrenoidosus.AAC.16
MDREEEREASASSVTQLTTPHPDDGLSRHSNVKCHARPYRGESAFALPHLTSHKLFKQTEAKNSRAKAVSPASGAALSDVIVEPSHGIGELEGAILNMLLPYFLNRLFHAMDPQKIIHQDLSRREERAPSGFTALPPKENPFLDWRLAVWKRTSCDALGVDLAVSRPKPCCIVGLSSFGRRGGFVRSAPSEAIVEHGKPPAFAIMIMVKLWKGLNRFYHRRMEARTPVCSRASESAPSNACKKECTNMSTRLRWLPSFAGAYVEGTQSLDDTGMLGKLPVS